jgi:SPP1 gp7 family putative phage head morphogenesis protein
MPTPTSYRLHRLLRRLFAAQARTLSSQMVLEGGEPDLAPWTAAAVEAVRPLVLALYQQGMLRSAALRPSQRGRDGMRTYRPGNATIFGKGVMSNGKDLEKVQLRRCRVQLHDLGCSRGRGYVTRAGRGYGAVGELRTGSSGDLRLMKHLGRPLSPGVARTATLEFGIDPYDPRVLDAVDQLCLQFCRETNETARVKLQEAKRRLREALKRGLARGNALRELTRAVRRIFADPQRAALIAVTESARAVNGGRLHAARETGVVGKQWLVSADACEQCLELDGEERQLDEPFIVLPGGGPYSRVMHPPLHPRCQCDWVEVI